MKALKDANRAFDLDCLFSRSSPQLKIFFQTFLSTLIKRKTRKNNSLFLNSTVSLIRTLPPPPRFELERLSIIFKSLSNSNLNLSPLRFELERVNCIRNNRYDGKFVSANIIKLSSRHLSKNKVSLLSKGLKLVPTPKHIKKAKIKDEIEAYGSKLRIM